MRDGRRGAAYCIIKKLTLSSGSSCFHFILDATTTTTTEEEEAAERQAMEEDEREQVHKDMFGSDDQDDEQAEPLPALTPTELATKIQQVRDALQQEEESSSSFLSATQTLAYRQAVTAVPALVEAETDWAGFLRLVDHNPSSAAERVARYWQVRTEFFGQKAHLPMTLQGALADEIALMELGLAFCLPTDTNGRAVLFVDRTRFSLRVASRESFLRVLFYMLYALAGKDNPRKGEFVIVVSVKVKKHCGLPANIKNELSYLCVCEEPKHSPL